MNSLHPLHILVRLNSSTTQSRCLTTLTKKSFESIEGKGDNAGNQHFIFFQQCFLLCPTQISIFEFYLLCCLQLLSIWTGLKFCRMVKTEIDPIELYFLQAFVFS